MSESESDDSMPELVSNSESESDSDLEDLDQERVFSDNVSDFEEEDDDAELLEAAAREGKIIAEVHSIQSRQEVNGRKVALQSFHAERGRFTVVEIGRAWERAGEQKPWTGRVLPEKLRLEGEQIARADEMRRAAEAAAAAAAAAAQQEPEPEPDPEREAEAARERAEAEQRETEKKERKKARKKEQQRRARERKREEQAAASAASELPPIEELTARERMEKLELVTELPLTEWNADRVDQWVRLIELDAAPAARAVLLMAVLRAFADEEIDGMELRTMSSKRLRHMLTRQQMPDNDLEQTASTVLELRDAVLATQRAVDGTGNDSATSAELAALKAGLEKEKKLRAAAEDEKQELEDEIDDLNDQLSRYMLDDRKNKELLSDFRQQLLIAEDEFGFNIPIREAGVLDCQTRRNASGAKTLPKCVEIEGHLGISELQSYVNDVQWHPVKTRVINGVAKEEIDWDDTRLREIEARYPKRGVGSFVHECWREIQFYNASGSYLVHVPWNLAENREMTPAEAVQAMCNSSCVKKKKRAR